MNTKKLIYTALGALPLLTSCAQDELNTRELPSESERIYFRSSLPTVTLSRAADLTSLNDCQVTCFNTSDPTQVGEDGILLPYFDNVCYENDGTGKFFSKGDEDYMWPDANSLMHFFAFYPSVDSMKSATGTQYHSLVNNVSLTESDTILDYRIENFRVAQDIADQVDFVTAYTKGTLVDHRTNGTKLDFKHNLARIELTAWGASEKYDFEIAGVRIGNAPVGGDFHFSELVAPTEATQWREVTENEIVEHIYGAGETLVTLSKNKGSHATENDIVSIMGNAGAAMVIPTPEKIEAWEGKADENTALPGYTTDKMYFSVLLRVINMAGEVAFPYSNADPDTHFIYLAVDKDSRIVSNRLYKTGNDYYTTSDPDDDAVAYTLGDNEEICSFCWAALPVPAKWDAGKKYTYKLNYTTGIGWHDPADPEPGEPIIERGAIPFDISVDEWVTATDYDPNIDIPKR